MQHPHLSPDCGGRSTKTIALVKTSHIRRLSEKRPGSWKQREVAGSIPVVGAGVGDADATAVGYADGLLRGAGVGKLRPFFSLRFPILDGLGDLLIRDAGEAALTCVPVGIVANRLHPQARSTRSNIVFTSTSAARDAGTITEEATMAAKAATNDTNFIPFAYEHSKIDRPGYASLATRRATESQSLQAPSFSSAFIRYSPFEFGKITDQTQDHERTTRAPEGKAWLDRAATSEGVETVLKTIVSTTLYF